MPQVTWSVLNFGKKNNPQEECDILNCSTIEYATSKMWHFKLWLNRIYHNYTTTSLAADSVQNRLQSSHSCIPLSPRNGTIPASLWKGRLELDVPSAMKVRWGERYFSSSAPRIWNALPEWIHCIFSHFFWMNFLQHRLNLTDVFLFSFRAASLLNSSLKRQT